MQEYPQLALTLNVSCLLALPLLFVFVVFNLGNMLFGQRIFRHPVARTTYSSFGLVGIPIHELSHLLMAVLFGHCIIKAKFFSWRTTAHVTHSYNASSTYQVMGNFFIAIAPFILSTVLVHYLVFQSFNFSIDVAADPLVVFKNALILSPELVLTFINDTKWWQLAIVVMLSFYCVPSNTDFSNAFQSLLLSLPVVFLAIFVGVILFDEVSLIVGTIVFMGVISSLTSIVWWLILFGLTFIPVQPSHH